MVLKISPLYFLNQKNVHHGKSHLMKQNINSVSEKMFGIYKYLQYLILAISGDRRPSPELVATVPIRKTRAGLQFTCAAPTCSDNGRDVWVCNSDGYVGQVCVLSLHPEPTVTSCNGVCNARILCVVAVPGITGR